MRKSVVWRCSKGFGAGRYTHEPCGKLNAIWTIFDPEVGGDRKRRWLGHCKYCPKVTAINSEAGNVVKVFDSRQEGVDFAEQINAEGIDYTEESNVEVKPAVNLESSRIKELKKENLALVRVIDELTKILSNIMRE